MKQEEAFSQLHLRFTDPIQFDYEVIRPVVLYSQTVAERSEETEMPRTTVREKAKRFVREGMLGLADKRSAADNEREIGYPGSLTQQIAPDGGQTTTGMVSMATHSPSGFKPPLMRIKWTCGLKTKSRPKVWQSLP
jgi:hypothetical protein